MKLLTALVLLALLLTVSGCQPTEPDNLQRQDDYRKKDLHEEHSLPSPDKEREFP